MQIVMTPDEALIEAVELHKLGKLGEAVLQSYNLIQTTRTLIITLAY